MWCCRWTARDVDDMQSLNYRIATHKPGDSVKVHVESGKNARDVTVTLALPPENPPRELTSHCRAQSA